MAVEKSKAIKQTIRTKENKDDDDVTTPSSGAEPGKKEIKKRPKKKSDSEGVDDMVVVKKKKKKNGALQDASSSSLELPKKRKAKKSSKPSSSKSLDATPSRGVEASEKPLRRKLKSKDVSSVAENTDDKKDGSASSLQKKLEREKNKGKKKSSNSSTANGSTTQNDRPSSKKALTSEEKTTKSGHVPDGGEPQSPLENKLEGIKRKGKTKTGSSGNSVATEDLSSKKSLSGDSKLTKKPKMTKAKSVGSMAQAAAASSVKKKNPTSSMAGWALVSPRQPTKPTIKKIPVVQKKEIPPVDDAESAGSTIPHERKQTESNGQSKSVLQQTTEYSIEKPTDKESRLIPKQEADPLEHVKERKSDPRKKQPASAASEITVDQLPPSSTKSEKEMATDAAELEPSQSPKRKQKENRKSKSIVPSTAELELTVVAAEDKALPTTPEKPSSDDGRKGKPATSTNHQEVISPKKRRESRKTKATMAAIDLEESPKSSIEQPNENRKTKPVSASELQESPGSSKNRQSEEQRGKQASSQMEVESRSPSADDSTANKGTDTLASAGRSSPSKGRKESRETRSTSKSPDNVINEPPMSQADLGDESDKPKAKDEAPRSLRADKHETERQDTISPSAETNRSTGNTTTKPDSSNPNQVASKISLSRIEGECESKAEDVNTEASINAVANEGKAETSNERGSDPLADSSADAKMAKSRSRGVRNKGADDDKAFVDEDKIEFAKDNNSPPADGAVKEGVKRAKSKPRGGRRQRSEVNNADGKRTDDGSEAASSRTTVKSSASTIGTKERVFDWEGSSRSNTPSPKPGIRHLSLSNRSKSTPSNSPAPRSLSTKESSSSSIRSSSSSKPGSSSQQKKSEISPGVSPAMRTKMAVFSSGTSALPSPNLFGLASKLSKSPKDRRVDPAGDMANTTPTIESKLATTGLESFSLPFPSSNDNSDTLTHLTPTGTDKKDVSQFASSKSALLEALATPARKEKEALAEINKTPRTLKRGFVDLNVKTPIKSNAKTPGQRVMDTSHHGKEKARTYVDSALDMICDEAKKAEVERLVSKIESLGGFPKTRRLSMRDNELVGKLVMAVRNDPRITEVHVDAGMFGSISSTLLSQFIDSLRVNLHVRSLSFHGLELGNDFLYDLAASMEYNFVVEEIDLSANLFTNEGLANFCQALATVNDSVKRLNLKNQTTPISEASQVDVLEAFEQNTTLKKVELDFISEDGPENLTKILERNRLLESKNSKNVDDKLIDVLTDEVERAQELWEQQQAELSIAEEEDNDWEYLYELAVLFDKHKLKKEVEENVKELSGPPKRTNADDLSAEEKKKFLFGAFKKNMEDSVMAFKEDGSFLTPEFITKYFKERPDEDALDFDFHGQWKLFKRFPIHDPARQVIVDKFVDAIAAHPRAKELTGINMANTGVGDDFLQALSKRCLEDNTLLPNLHTVNFETNFINEPGVVALANLIASPEACKYLQVIRLENQKGLLKSKAEFALAKAMRVNRSIVVISLTIRNLLERERLGKYIMRNVDLIRQARQEHMKATGTQRKRNKVEQVFDRVRENDPDLTQVNMVGNERFRTLTQEEKVKAASSFAQNTSVKEVYLNGCGIDDSFAHALGESFSTNTTLEKVHIEGNDISGVGIKALFVGLGKNSSIKELRLHKQSKLLATADEETLSDYLNENHTVSKIGMDLRSKVAQVKLDRKMGYNINLELKEKAAGK